MKSINANRFGDGQILLEINNMFILRGNEKFMQIFDCYYTTVVGNDKVGELFMVLEKLDQDMWQKSIDFKRVFSPLKRANMYIKIA